MKNWILVKVLVKNVLNYELMDLMYRYSIKFVFASLRLVSVCCVLKISVKPHFMYCKKQNLMHGNFESLTGSRADYKLSSI